MVGELHCIYFDFSCNKAVGVCKKGWLVNDAYFILIRILISIDFEWKINTQYYYYYYYYYYGPWRWNRVLNTPLLKR